MALPAGESDFISHAFAYGDTEEDGWLMRG
jgi:hypothetical protein